MLTDEELRALREEDGPTEREHPDWWYHEATKPQLGYITNLVEDRIVPDEWLERIKEYNERGMLKGEAGQIISELKKLPLKGPQDRSKDQPDPDDVPAGRYCIDYGDDNLIFYRVYRHKNNKRFVKVYIKAGPNEYEQPFVKAKLILKVIYRAGIGEAAIRYGKELGCCSKCGTELTNRVSRRLRVGPICGGRIFPDWQERVRRVRQACLDEGLDPDEALPPGPIRDDEV